MAAGHWNLTSSRGVMHLSGGLTRVFIRMYRKPFMILLLSDCGPGRSARACSAAVPPPLKRDWLGLYPGKTHSSRSRPGHAGTRPRGHVDHKSCEKRERAGDYLQVTSGVCVFLHSNRSSLQSPIYCILVVQLYIWKPLCTQALIHVFFP